MSIIIKVSNISKQYRLGQVSTGSLFHDINRIWHKLKGKEDPYLKLGEANDRTKKADNDYVWALKNINFEIKQGDVVGIIGRNGAGKSTLLKILSRTTAPTTGKIKIKGRVASLLEVGTGFHPELSGRDNIYLNGAILGMRKKEIQKKFDEIVDFAGVERYIDTPVKRYSSGMYVRLAFAVAAHLEPEILIVDEVLAVGDAEFQKKCLGKMKQVSDKEGRTVLFVSHNMAAVAKLCNRGLILNNGQFLFDGDINDAVNSYMKEGVINSLEYIANQNQSKNHISQVKILLDNENKFKAFSFDNTIQVEIKIHHPYQVSKTNVGIAVLDKWHQKIFTDTMELSFKQSNEQFTTLKVTIPARVLLAGIYYLDVALFVPRLNNFDYVTDACSFEIQDLYSEFSIFNGTEIGNVMVKCNWQIQ